MIPPRYSDSAVFSATNLRSPTLSNGRSAAAGYSSSHHSSSNVYDSPGWSTALGLMGSAWQSLYHFTVGGAVDDARLQTLPAYESSKGSRI